MKTTLFASLLLFTSCISTRIERQFVGIDSVTWFHETPTLDMIPLYGDVFALVKKGRVIGYDTVYSYPSEEYTREVDSAAAVYTEKINFYSDMLDSEEE